MKKMIIGLAALSLAAAPLSALSQVPLTFLEQQSQSEVLSSDFIGSPVVTKDNQRIGAVSNLVFDQTGHIELAVIGIGGFLGVGEKEVAVPFDSLKSEEQNNKHVLVIDATKEQLKAAPVYKTLNQLALQQRLADWRAKATEGWSKVKVKANEALEKANEAYHDAKEKAGEAYQDAKSHVQDHHNDENAPK